MTDTTTRAEALAKLIAKVEAGDGAGVKKASSAIASSARDAGQYWPHHDILKAYFHGSTDAAIAWLSAELPEWAWEVHLWPGPKMLCSAAIRETRLGESGSERWHWGGGGRFDTNAETPSRALLLAGLRALEQQEGAKG